MKVIGITGGVGAGKSEVLSYIESAYDAVIVKADSVAAELLKPCGKAYLGIKGFMPPEIYEEDGSINNRKMATVFFTDRNFKERVNSVVFPLVKEAIRDIIEEAAYEGKGLLVIEAALLIEEHYDEICDELWYVYADRDIRAARLRQSRGYTDERIEAVMQSQLSDDEFKEGTDVIINNSGDFEETKISIDNELLRLGVERWEQ